MKRRVLTIVVVLVGVYFVVSLSRQVWNLWQGRDRLDLARERLQDAENENEQLRTELEYRQSYEFVESEARNRLNFTRDGEKIVILPQELNEPKGESETGSKRANWQKWWGLLFDV